MAFERRQWIVQRAGWAMMLLIIVAALAGIFGNGALSRTSASRNGLRCEYERFLRVAAPAQLRIWIPSSSGEARLAIRREYFEAVPYQRVRPQPRTVTSSAGNLVFVFDPGDSRELEVAFDLEPRTAGVAMLLVRNAPGGAGLRLRQFVYP